jgi:hypothetical protein
LKNLRLGARSVAVVPATDTAVMGAGTATSRRAGRTIITFSTDPMTFALRLQPGNCQHACQYHNCEELIHIWFSTRIYGGYESRWLSAAGAWLLFVQLPRSFCLFLLAWLRASRGARIVEWISAGSHSAYPQVSGESRQPLAIAGRVDGYQALVVSLASSLLSWSKRPKYSIATNIKS